MWDFLMNRMQVYPASVFFDSENRYTYIQIVNAVRRHGHLLQSRLTLGTKCAILCDKGMNTALAILACWCAGMIPVPMSKNYGKRHIESIIELINPDILITDNIGRLQFEFIYDIKSEIFLGNKYCYQNEAGMDEVTIIMCTSGTTGKPKGAMITTDGLKKNILAIADYFNITFNDTILIARPLYHCAVLTGEFLISIYQGVNISFYDELYSPPNILNFVDKNNVTVLCGTPTLFNHIAMFAKKYIKGITIQKIALSGECLTKKASTNISEAFPDAAIYNVYGLTEASPRVSYLPPEYFEQYSESVGIPLKETVIRIIDKEKQIELPANFQGRVMVQSPSLMIGYYNNKQLTNTTIIDGWLDTHDIGYKDENGFLYILSRADDMIIKAGMNIYPKEIENAINDLPEVYEVMAYGIDGEIGQNIAVDIVMCDEYADIGMKILLTRFSSVLSSFQMPVQVNVVNKLKRNASGKIIRRGID